MEKPSNRTGITSNDANGCVSFQNRREPGILPGRHFAKIGNTFEGETRITQLLKDGVFGSLRDGLGKRTAAIEDF